MTELTNIVNNTDRIATALEHMIGGIYNPTGQVFESSTEQVSAPTLTDLLTELVSVGFHIQIGWNKEFYIRLLGFDGVEGRLYEGGSLENIIPKLYNELTHKYKHQFNKAERPST